MIAITGATGQLGQLVIEHLLKRNVNPKDIVAVVRNPAAASALKEKGIQVREGDYAKPQTLEKAFAGVDKVLLISSNELGQRVVQHQNVVNAAKAVKVKQIVYTSLLKADTSQMQLAGEHLATEKAIRASGLNFVFLRNGWYIENYTGQLASFLERGAIAGSAQDGKISAATRSDYAEAAAVVLLSAEKENKIYELAGASFTLTNLASIISEITGKEVVYADMPVDQYEELLLNAQLPPAIASMLSNSDLGISRGDLFSESKDLENLIGHKAQPLPDVIKTTAVK